MMVQVEWVSRPSMLFDVGGGTNQVARHWGQSARHEGGIGERRNADCRIKAFSDQVVLLIAELKVDDYLWIEGEELREEWRYGPQAIRQRRCQANQAAWLDRLGQGVVLGGLSVGE